MMFEQLLVVFIMLVCLLAFMKGGIRTFQRNWALALIVLIFLTPFWIFWAFVEMFLKSPN